MGYTVTNAMDQTANQQNKKPSLVLEIDGLEDRLFSVSDLVRYARVGDVGLFVDGSWVIGGTTNDNRADKYISIDGTTNSISQQLQQDRSGTTSITSIQIALVDYRQEISQLVSPSFDLTDIMGRKAWVWLGFQDTLFPEDHVILFSGVIDEVSAAGLITLNIAHPETIKRQEIFKKATSPLTDTLFYKSVEVQSMRFTADPLNNSAIQIRYTTGGTAGSEVVSVSGNDVSVQIQDGVSTANQIRKALRSSAAASALLSAEVINNEGSVAQTAFSYTPLTSSTVIALEDVSEFLEEYSTEFLTYVRINDEIIRYDTIDLLNNELNIAERGCFGTIPVTHEIEDEANTIYRLIGQADTLALKVLCSGQNEYFLEDIPLDNFVRSASGTDIPDTIFIAGVNVKEKYGIVAGDFITTTGATNGANNVSLETISSIEVNEEGSVITCTGAGFVSEIETQAVASFKSKYNVLPDGCGLGGDRIDIQQFEDYGIAFASYFPDYDFYLHDTVKSKEFLDKEVLYPANLFTLPRKGKISCGYVSPPLSFSSLARLDSSNVVQPDKISVKRSLGRYFYNTVIYKFDFDAVETDRALAGYIRTDEDSKNQIPVGTKSLIITSNGLRNNTDTTQKIDIMSSRILDRYRFVAESITLSVFYSIGYNIEVGDIVYFGDENLKILDSKNGRRGFAPRLCEVVDKKMNIFTGRIDLVIVDTNYLANGRFGIFSPSTILGSGSTATELQMTQSYGTESFELERDKWVQHIGQAIVVRSNDWSVSYNSVIRGFDPADPTIMLVDDLGASPPAGYIIEVPPYPNNSDPDDSFQYKNKYCFFDPQIEVISGTSGTVFSVGAGDVGKLFLGCTIRVHSPDFTDDSGDVTVEDISGTTVTVSSDLGFTPSSGDLVDLIGFNEDGGAAYRWL